MVKCDLLKLHHILGRKWTIILILGVQKGKMTFNQLWGHTNKQINKALLSATLKELERLNIITKLKEDKVYYTLAENGGGLISLLNNLKDWCKRNNLEVEEDCYRCRLHGEKKIVGT